MNTASVNYLDSLANLTDSFKFPNLLNRTVYEQTLLFSLRPFDFNSELLKAPKTLKDFVHQFQHRKEIFDLQERHNDNNFILPNKIFLFNNQTVDIFLFVTAIISLVVTTIVMYILCKHMKLKTLVTSLSLQQIKEVGTVVKQEHVSIEQDIECTCKIQWYNILTLSLSIFGLVNLVILKSRKLKPFTGHLFSNAVKIMLFISDTQYYVPIKLCRTAGSIHLFKITGTLTPKM